MTGCHLFFQPASSSHSSGTDILHFPELQKIEVYSCIAFWSTHAIVSRLIAISTSYAMSLSLSGKIETVLFRGTFQGCWMNKQRTAGCLRYIERSRLLSIKLPFLACNHLYCLSVWTHTVVDMWMKGCAAVGLKICPIKHFNLLGTVLSQITVFLSCSNQQDFLYHYNGIPHEPD